MKGFIDFIRERGVIGFATGFIVGGAVSKVVSAAVTDIINPIIGLLIGATGGLRTAIIPLGPADILIGDFIGSIIDFAAIVFVVYFAFKILKLEKLDKKREDAVFK